MAMITNNAIGWACLQLSGGWKRVGWVCGILAVALPLLIFGSLQLYDSTLYPQQAQRTLRAWFMMLGFVQGGLILIGAPSRVHAAIRRDRIGKLIESHRLMPVPARQAVMGYIVGSNLFLLCCVGTIFVIGGFLAVAAGEDLRGWAAMHLAMLALATLLSCAVAFSAQWLPKFNPALVIIFVGPVFLGTMGAGLTFLPPAQVLFAPYFGSGFAALQRGEVNGLHVLAVASQILLAAILFVGACRRYRRDDVPALGFGWGITLLGLWIVLCIGGLVMGETNWMGRVDATSERVSFIVAASISMLLAVGPIGSAAVSSVAWRDRKAIDPHFIDRKPIGIVPATAMVALVVVLLLAAAPRWVAGYNFEVDGARVTAPHLLTGGVQIVLANLTIAILAWGAVRARMSVLFLVGPWVAVVWALVPILDGVASVMTNRDQAFPHAISGISPPVCLALIWMGNLSAATIGMAAQAGLLLACFMAWAGLKRSNASRSDGAAATG